MKTNWKYINGTAHYIDEQGDPVLCANCSGTPEQHQKVAKAFSLGFDTQHCTTGTCPECDKLLNQLN